MIIEKSPFEVGIDLLSDCGATLRAKCNSESFKKQCPKGSNFRSLSAPVPPDATRSPQACPEGLKTALSRFKTASRRPQDSAKIVLVGDVDSNGRPDPLQAWILDRLG